MLVFFPLFSFVFLCCILKIWLHSLFVYSVHRICSSPHWYNNLNPWHNNDFLCYFTPFLALSLFLTHPIRYIFLVSCTLINALIHLFIHSPGLSSQSHHSFNNIFFSSRSILLLLNTWLLCVYTVKRSFGKNRQHFFLKTIPWYLSVIFFLSFSISVFFSFFV